MSRSILTTSHGVNRAEFTGLDWLRFVSVSLIWGSSFLFIAIGLDAFNPGFVTWLRVGSGAAALLMFRSVWTPIDREDLPGLVILSLTWVAVPFTLFPVAQQWIESAVAGMINGGLPIFAATIASMMLRTLPGRLQVVGIAVGFAGVVAISVPSLGEGSSQALGVGLILLAQVLYGLSVNIAAPLQQKYGSLPVMGRMLALAALWTAPYGIYGLADSAFAWESLVAVLTAGVLGTGIAFVLMGALVGSVGPTRGSFITYLIPVVALFLGVAFRDETVSIVAIGGVGLVIAGAILASRREA